MRTSSSRLLAIVLIAGSAISASGSDSWRRPADPARGIRAIAKSGQVTTIDVPETGPEARVIIELTERPLLGRREQGRLRSERAELDRVHARLARDVARIQGELASRKGPRSLSTGSGLRHEYRIAFSGASAVVDREALPAIAALPYVKAVHPDRKVYARLETSVPLIGVPQVWEQSGVRGKGVTVAILDTGIDYTHAALSEGFIGGYDFINDDDDPMDDHGHGTHVAGIVAGNAAPVIGVAPEASLLAYKVLNDGGYGEDSGLLAAIERLLDPDGNGEFSDRADVVNMSLGKVATIGDDPVVDAIEAAVQAGVTFAVAAGNDGAYFSVGSPGVAPSVITVGATDRDDLPAHFTSQGPVANGWLLKPEVSAPGIDIVSAAMGAETLDASGTSMAAPHVAGVAALLRELHPQWTPAEVKAAIVSTARPLDSILASGSGRVDALAASRATILPSPSTLSFGVAGSSAPTATLRLINRGTTSQSVTVASPGMPMTIEPSSMTINAGETVTVTLTLRTGGVAPEPNDGGFGRSGRVSITTVSGTSQVPWLLITGNLVAATYTGNEAAIVVMARDGYILAEGFRTAVASTEAGNIDIVVITIPQRGDQPRIIVRENHPVDGGVNLVRISPDEATLQLNLNGLDEHGEPLRSLGVMSKGGVWLTGFKFVLPSGMVMEIGGEVTMQWAPEPILLVSPMPTTLIQTYEGEWRAYSLEDVGYIHVAHLGVHRDLAGIRQNEILTFSPEDWVKQKVDNPCATDCTNYLTLAAGPQAVVTTHFGWTHTRGTVSLTRGGGERAPWFSLSVAEAERPQVPFTKGVTVISPAFHVGEDGQMAMRAFSSPSPIDYKPPAGEPLAYGHGAPLLRTIMGMRWAADSSRDYDEWSINVAPIGPLGEEFADDSLRLRIAMYDANGVANPGVRLFSDNFVLTNPLTPGKHRLEIIDEYRLGDRMGRGTLISQIDTATNAAAPSLTSLRIVDANGRSVTNIGVGTETLQFSARESVYSFTNQIRHHELDSAATRVWWRSHGSSEWRALDINLTGIDYGAQDRAGPAGTIYRASLRHIAATQRGAIDLKFALASPTGATTEWTMEPAFFVTPARRRAAGLR